MSRRGLRWSIIVVAILTMIAVVTANAMQADGPEQYPEQDPDQDVVCGCIDTMPW